MRKLTSFLFMSLDGVVEAPDTYVRPDVFEDFSTLIGQTIAEQDSVLLGRRTYEEWSAYWPTSDIQPFSGFINHAPKFIVSKTLATADWHRSTILSGPLDAEIARLKTGEGGTIGVHGSIGLVHSLLVAGLLDEMRFILCPVVAGSGRRLLTDRDGPIQLDLTSAQSTPTGLQYIIYHPR
jgi:dihydrofolate reductase